MTYSEGLTVWLLEKLLKNLIQIAVLAPLTYILAGIAVSGFNDPAVDDVLIGAVTFGLLICGYWWVRLIRRLPA